MAKLIDGAAIDSCINRPAIIEAVKPYGWINDFPQFIAVSPELEERVKGKWGKQLGL